MHIRGIPEQLISDNEASFVKTSKDLEAVANSPRVKKFLNQNRLSWHFYTAKSPNKGGFIERLNALVKRVVSKSIGKSLVSYEEFRTLISYAMSAINDRPLTYIYNELYNETEILTPSMLLCGFNTREPPNLNFNKQKDSAEIKLSQRYYFLQRIMNTFWHQWQTLYLQELQERHFRQQGSKSTPSIPQPGDIVLIKGDGKTPRREWKLGKILEAQEKRGAIRECLVQTLSPKGNILSKIKRSPHNLIPLEINESLTDSFQKNSRKLSEEFDSALVTKPILPAKYSKHQLRIFKKRKILPPYKLGPTFKNPHKQNADNQDPLKNIEKTTDNPYLHFAPKQEFFD